MFLSPLARFFVATHVVDFRKRQYGLLPYMFQLGLDPYKGDVLLFVNRNRTRINILYGDSTGLLLTSKIFSRGAMKTLFRFAEDPSCQSISMAELNMLIEGAAYTVSKRMPIYLPER